MATKATPSIQHELLVEEINGVKMRNKSTSQQIRDSRDFCLSQILSDDGNDVDSGLIDDESQALFEYAELTNQRLLRAFMDSGVTYAHAKQLGITLGLPPERIERIRNSNDKLGPAVFATDIVIEWLKKAKHESNREAFLALEEKLRVVHMNCIIGKLRRRSCEDVAPALTELVGSVTESFTKEDAIRFGEKIGLTKRAIYEVMEENQLTQSRGSYVAAALFQEAERRNTILRHRFIEVVTDGLEEVCDRTCTDDDVKTDMKDKVKDIKENSLKRNMNATSCLAMETEFRRSEKTRGVERRSTGSTHQGSGHFAVMSPQFHSGNEMDTTGNKKIISSNKPSKRTARVCIGLIAAATFLPLIIFLALIPVSLKYPQYESPPEQVILPGSTIMYELADAVWIRSLEYQIIGSGRCSVDILSIDCSSIRYKEYYDEVVEDFDYIYLNEGASVTFSSAAHSFCSPTYIWIFNDFRTAEKNAKNHFEDLACSNPPDGILCVKLNSTVLSTTTPTLLQSSYYFIRCSNDPSCGFLSNITIHNYTEYDIEHSEETNSIDHTDISTGPNGKGSITIQSNAWYPQSSPICILARLSDNCEIDEYYIYSTPDQNPVLSYYVYVACGLSVLPIVVYFVCITVYCVRKKSSHIRAI